MLDHVNKGGTANKLSSSFGWGEFLICSINGEDEDYVEDVDYEEEGAELEEGTFSFEAKKADELEVTHRESPPTYEESAGEI